PRPASGPNATSATAWTAFWPRRTAAAAGPRTAAWPARTATVLRSASRWRNLEGKAPRMSRLKALLSLSAGAALLAVLPARAADRPRERELPRFTEEREAAALFFLKKHVPEVLPLLDQLKKTNKPQYEREIREVFRVTEMLADLQDDPRRYDL